jgi:hypothetical protein
MNLSAQTLDTKIIDLGSAPSRPEPDDIARRAELAVQFIAAGSRVLDLSPVAGLGSRLPNGCSYVGRELVRCDAGAVCNIAGGDFPTQAATQSDVVVMLGELERVADIENLFTQLRFAKQDVILSYCATDLMAAGDRAAEGFVNHLSFYDLAMLFDRFGFRIECTAPAGGAEVLMRLTPTERLKPVTPCSVAVISCGGDGQFGERLGRQMIDALLPGEAEVHHMNLATLGEAHESYDLAVIGVGSGMFQPLLGDELIGIAQRAKASIGIFGTQYRELIPRIALDRLLDRLDIWFARNEDDLLMYGRGRANAVHLGDWLIDAFPLSRPSDDEPLQVTEEIRDNHALDRAIQTIQRYRSVYSARLHPFLCALTSAEMVAYSDAPNERMPGATSGEFRSLLIDIFGRSYLEREFFMVDRDAVMRYKARVHRNVAQVKERIDGLLRNVAVATA